ncbi:fungal-specific transcription factor domain-containing protein [Mycena rebaudengoi]|nr:fungal-specific transcription factor domain-containing protein [Mycena rebaudengoi]
MSSNEDEYDGGAQSSKKRRIQRACDICRRKKIRCDGAQMPGNRCTNCVAYGFDCSYVEAAKKRGPPKGYVESVENRVEQIERLLQTILSEAELERHLAESSMSPVPADDEEDERAQFSLEENLQRLTLSGESTAEPRFFGRSSGAMLFHQVIKTKADVEPPQQSQRHTEFWASKPSPDMPTAPAYNFPPPDLAPVLVDLYFAHTNLHLPLLHRPTFERALAGGLHHTNDAFAATFLLVCALGARWSTDARVVLPGEEHQSAGWRWFAQVPMRDLLVPLALYDLQVYALSALFLQGTSAPISAWTLVGVAIRCAQDVGAHRRKSPAAPPPAPATGPAAPTDENLPEDELWKRGFWVLVFLDRMHSLQYGRPCAIQDEDFDLDLPIDCDDEYWPGETRRLRAFERRRGRADDRVDGGHDGRGHEEGGYEPDQDMYESFAHPRGVPSRVSAFIAHLRLWQVLSFALRSLYTINKSKFFLGLSNNSKANNGEWEQRIVRELDDALEKWAKELPDHLRWDPTREDDAFFEQSVVLHCAYYLLQIMIHRPSGPKKGKEALPLGPDRYPALAICTNAARSCSRVADMHRQRTGGRPLPFVQTAVFTSGVILLLSIWGGKQSGLSTDPTREMADVHRCMQVLRACEDRWQDSGRLYDLLYGLANTGQLPLPTHAASSNKRERGAQEPKTSPKADEPSPISANIGVDGRPIAGRRRRNTDVSSHISRPVLPPMPELRPMMNARRVHRSEVPAITTQFLPQHYQQRSHAYGPDTPSSESSLHSRGLQHNLYGQPVHAGQPNTPLSSASLHSQQEIFVPSMHRPMEYAAPPREMLDSHPAGSTGQHHGWYAATPAAPIGLSLGEVFPRHAPRSSRSHPNLSAAINNSNNNTHRPPVGSPLAASFPMSEAFYEQLTASFASGSHNVHDQHYETHSQEGYSHMEYGVLGDGHHRGHVQLQHAPGRHGHAHGGDGALPGQSLMEDHESMAMWSEAPIGFEVDHWGSYLTTVTDVAQGRMHAGGTLS